MKFLLSLFNPWNRLTTIGIILIIVGFILTPLIIGIPILVTGFLLGSMGIWYGVYKTVIKFVPNGEERVKKIKQDIIDSYKPFFRRVKQ